MVLTQWVYTDWDEYSELTQLETSQWVYTDWDYTVSWHNLRLHSKFTQLEINAVSLYSLRVTQWDYVVRLHSESYTVESDTEIHTENYTGS